MQKWHRLAVAFAELNLLECSQFTDYKLFYEQIYESFPENWRQKHFSIKCHEKTDITPLQRIRTNAFVLHIPYLLIQKAGKIIHR